MTFLNRVFLEAIKTEPVSTFQNLTQFQRISPSKELKVNSLQNQIVQMPNSYKIYGYDYDCTKPGIYRFWQFEKHQIQFVVFGKSHMENALFISLMAIRGNSDDMLSLKKKSHLMTQKFLCLTCGPLAQLIVHLMQQNGAEIRIVHVFTDQKWNSYNDSHTLVEIWAPEHKKYIAVDVDKKSIYESKGTPLNLLELSELVNLGQDFTMRNYAKHDLIDWSGFKSAKVRQNFSFFEMLIYSSPDQKKQLISRLSRMPMISWGGENYFCVFSDEQRNFLNKKFQNHVILTKSQFQNKFYTR